jgi:hypothetical protein
MPKTRMENLFGAVRSMITRENSEKVAVRQEDARAGRADDSILPDSKTGRGFQTAKFVFRDYEFNIVGRAGIERFLK